jgi:uncharacterized membrane protein YbaN (DUF454 family)
MAKASPRRFVRVLFIVAGTISLVLGVIGIFVPLLPTTPFLLLASACYMRGSERLHRWLLSHGRLGAYIRAFEEGRGIPRRAKIVAIGALWISIAYGATKVESVIASGGIVAVAVGVTVYLLRLPTLR